MSEPLHQLLHERAKVGATRLSLWFVFSAGLHGLAVGAILFAGRTTRKPEEVKVTWVTLPAMGGDAPSGGSGPMEEGQQGERVRRVEEVAPADAGRSGVVTPNAFGTTKAAPTKGTNPNSASLGKAPEASKGKNPTKNPVTGAAGQGSGGGLGQGSSVPGLRSSAGATGGTGLIGDMDGNFPFVWYLQSVQNTITGNWNRYASGQGRVQIYFRIRRNGALEAARVEIPSGNASMDQSALLAVRRSDPLPRLPEGFDGDSLGVHFWFTYLGE